jgi:hypothetical protein
MRDKTNYHHGLKPELKYNLLQSAVFHCHHIGHGGIYLIGVPASEMNLARQAQVRESDQAGGIC